MEKLAEFVYILGILMWKYKIATCLVIGMLIIEQKLEKEGE